MNPRSLRFRMTAWYAGLLAGSLIIFSVSVYIGLEGYLNWNLKRALSEEGRAIGVGLMGELPSKGSAWVAQEINEQYAPEANGRFIRITTRDGKNVFTSGEPKDHSFDPLRIPPQPLFSDYSRRLEVAPKHQFMVQGTVATAPDKTAYFIETGASYDSVNEVLHGLQLTLALYMPVLVALAIGGGYWLMRRALRPVDEITRQAERITSRNLSDRLPVIETGDELERLSNSLNRMIARLEAAFQHIHRFSADSSHELRTPLTILKLELEGMTQHRNLSPELLEQIGSALEETARLTKIVENLLVISRLDAGEAQMESVPVDLGELAASTTEQLRLLAEEESVGLHCDVSPAVTVEGDRARLKQVLVNLLDNAIKYTPEGGKIDVKVHSKSGKAVLEVIDNGVGISSEALPHIFERFYREDKARSRQSGGTGLGLAIVKAICAAHHGEIYISRMESPGTRVTVELPLVSASAPSPGESALPWNSAFPGASQAPAGSGKKV